MRMHDGGFSKNESHHGSLKTIQERHKAADPRRQDNKGAL